MNYQYYTLSNGIRVIHRYTDSSVAHCGIIINTGTRDETEQENGIAHFIEHVIFKGTKKRKAYHILSRLENVGGDLNAYTTKEETCIYASFLNRYYDRTIELIADIILNSSFPDKEIEKEKDVVIDEINSYKDTPSEEIYDEFEEIVFKNHPIGKNILGTPDNVKKISRDAIKNFIDKNYFTDQIVISSVGKIDFKKLILIIEKYFGDFPAKNRLKKRAAFNDYKPSYRSVEKKTYLSHCCIGNIAFKRKDKRRIAMVLLNNILGGPGLNSRLNLAVRERHGYTYNIESQYQPYSDTGIFCIYLGTDNDFLNKSISLVQKELKILAVKKLGLLQLKRAKQQLIGQLAIAYESNLSEMLSMGKGYLHLNKVDTINEIYRKIEKITSEELLEIANEIFSPAQMSILIYQAKMNIE